MISNKKNPISKEITMLKKFKIINNLDIKPTFDVKEITVLKNDCLDYLDLYNGQTEDFHESDPY